MLQIMYGTHVKLQFKLKARQEQRFWLKEVRMLFTIPSPSLWNCAMNVVGFIILRFYIFIGERLWDDYIKFYKPRTCMAMQEKA
jgi:hypothetical protein